MTETTVPYNPLDMANLAESVVGRLLEQDPVPLGVLPRFTGAGLYALYYTGDHPLYELLAASNRDGAWEQPIYVGKAVPKGGRKGVVDHASRTTALRGRLGEHADSVVAAEDLDVQDFFCRWLVVDPIWIPLGESLLITRYMPVWNRLVDGFGNHDPGAGRREGARSLWDTLHPGRAWAELLKPKADDRAKIGQDVLEYLRQRLEPTDS